MRVHSNGDHDYSNSNNNSAVSDSSDGDLARAGLEEEAGTWGGVGVEGKPGDFEPPSAQEDGLEERGVTIKGLRKVFGDKVAVAGLNLRLLPGEITCLLGHNGAGELWCVVGEDRTTPNPIGLPVYPIVSQYIPLYPIISHCVPLYPIVYLCMPLHPSVFHYFTLYPIISHCILLYPIVSHYIPLYPIAPHYITLYPIVSHCILLYPIISQCIPLYPFISHSTPLYPTVLYPTVSHYTPLDHIASYYILLDPILSFCIPLYPIVYPLISHCVSLCIPFLWRVSRADT